MLLAIAMHASFNLANGFAGLRIEEALQENDDLLMLALSAATIWMLVAVLITTTDGRLGSGASRRMRRGERHSLHVAWLPT